jgi:hypothetical protein
MIIPHFIMFLLISCTTAGSGISIKAERNIKAFDSVVFESQGMMNISIGENEKVEINIDDNLVDSIITEVHGGVLYIANQSSVTSTQLIVNIVIPQLKKVQLNGSGSIVVSGIVTNDDLSVILEGSGSITIQGKIENVIVSLSGSGNIDADIESHKGNFQISGSGSLMIKGKCIDTSIGINSMGNFLGKDFRSETAYVELWGSGNCEIEVFGKIKSKIMGSGNIKVKGEPEFENNILGPGQVIQVK